jgi:lysophospholipase L1-like esterase
MAFGKLGAGGRGFGKGGSGVLGGPMWEKFPRVAILGDSLGDNNSTANNYNGFGYLSQAQARSGWAFDFDDSLNKGISGETSSQILARVGDVIALAPDRCWLTSGGNDVTNGTAANTVIANIAATVSALTDAGIWVDLIPLLPRTYLMDSTKRALQADIVAGQVALAGGRCIVHRCDLAILDTGSPTNDPIAGALTDGLHPGVYGSDVMADPILAYYSRFGGFWERQLQGTLRSVNPTLTGSAGTKGTAATGTVASNWRLERSSGTTISAVGSKVADDAGQIITFSSAGGGATGELVRLINTANITVADLQAGDLIQSEVDIVATGLVNVRNVRLQAQSTITGVHLGMMGVSTTTDRERASFTRRQRCQKFAVTTPATEQIATSVIVEADCSGGAVSGTIEIRNLSTRKVT